MIDRYIVTAQDPTLDHYFEDIVGFGGIDFLIDGLFRLRYNEPSCRRFHFRFRIEESEPSGCFMPNGEPIFRRLLTGKIIAEWPPK